MGGVLGGLAGGGQGALAGMLALGTLGTLGGMAFGDDDERTVGETLADTTINAPLWGGIGTAAIATAPLWAQGLSGGDPARTGGGEHNRPHSALNRRGRMFQERMQQPKEVTYKYGAGGSTEDGWHNWLTLIGLIGGGLLGSSRGGTGR